MRASGKPFIYPLELGVVRNRDRGEWFNPVPEVGVSSGPAPRTRFRDFLPVSELGEIPRVDVEDSVRRVLEGRYPQFSCFLADEWRFDEIDRGAQGRQGHEFEGRKRASVGEIVLRGIYDLEDALERLHPDISPASRADFFCSWQVWRHIR